MTRAHLEESLARRLSELIHELRDPRVPAIVTITRVRLNRDSSQARVLVSALGSEEDLAALETALNHAGGHLQRGLAGIARRTPKLSFFTNPLEVPP